MGDFNINLLYNWEYVDQYIQNIENLQDIVEEEYQRIVGTVKVD